MTGSSAPSSPAPSSTASIRIALADDQALIRNGLAALLGGFAGLSVRIQAADGRALLEAVTAAAVDVIVSDIRMPRLSGLELVRALRERGDATPVLLLTTFDDPGLLQAARAAGAQGYLLKDAAPEELCAAIEALAAGQTRLSPISLQPARAGHQEPARAAQLTEREQSILRLVAGGYSNKEIGRALHISDGTVKNHLTDILAKLDARDRTHAVLKSIAAGWL